MPTFFNEAALTEEQKARWPACVLEYERVLESNLERRLAKLTQQERADLNKPYALAEFVAQGRGKFTGLDVDVCGEAVAYEFLALVHVRSPGGRAACDEIRRQCGSRVSA